MDSLARESLGHPGMRQAAAPTVRLADHKEFSGRQYSKVDKPGCYDRSRVLKDTYVVLYPSGPVSGTFHLALLSSLGKKT